MLYHGDFKESVSFQYGAITATIDEVYNHWKN